MVRNRKSWSPACKAAVTALGSKVVQASPCAHDVKTLCATEKCPKECITKHFAQFSPACQSWASTTLADWVSVASQKEDDDAPRHGLHGRHHFPVFLVFIFVALFCCCVCRCRRKCKRACRHAQDQYPGVRYEHVQEDRDLEMAILASQQWACSACTLENAPDATACVACGTARAVAPAAVPVPAPVPVIIATAPVSYAAPVMPPMAAPTRPGLYPAVYAPQPALVQYRAPA
jgi:hypothetical protein